MSKPQQQTIYYSDTAVSNRYGVSRSTIWRWTEQQRFPEPIKLSPGCTRWRLDDLEMWESSKQANRGEG